jgi:hypothetical protein
MELAHIPESLKAACRGVVDLPDRDITISEAARLWASDRSSLGECARRHKGLSDAIRAVEGQGK